MRQYFFRFFLLSILFFFVSDADGQARLTISNNSMRSMTIKVMKSTGGKGSLHKTVTISAYGSETVYFSNTGYYFTKSKATLDGKEPVYQKGKPFIVYNGEDGYSVMTLTFTIKESNIPQVSGGEKISKSEFDQN